MVGCDGVHSAVRRSMQPDEGPPLWNGVTMWRGVTEMPPFLDGRTMILAGIVRHRIVVYPIRDLADGRQLVNWVAEVRTEDGRPMPPQSWNRVVDVAEPLRHFAEFDFDWLDVPKMIGERPRCSPIRWSIVIRCRHGVEATSPCSATPPTRCIPSARTVPRRRSSMLGCWRASWRSNHRWATPSTRTKRARLPATAAVVAANRAAGPEQCMELVAERAPHGFDRLDDVISQDELAAIAARYRVLAGFDPAALNERPSFDVAVSD